MSPPNEEVGPFHLINNTTGKFTGPFTTKLDAFACTKFGWNTMG